MIVVITYIDRKTGRSVVQESAKNGPKLPSLPGLKVLWSRASQYPTNVPEFVCQVDPGDYQQVEGVLYTLTEEEAGVQYKLELQARAKKDYEQKAAPIRQQRNLLLDSSDKYMVPDYPVSDIKREEWKVYRQQLRDVTSQETFPEYVEWPQEPQKE